MAENTGAAVDTVIEQEREELLAIREEKARIEAAIKELKQEITLVQQELVALEFEASDEPGDQRSSQLKKIIKLFNGDPKKGMKQLIENGFVEKSAESIAKFLFSEEGLRKTSIGEFLGEGEELNIETLRQFSLLHEFAGMDFDQALRSYLWSFRLPGEAQKIDRMMETFAKRYCDQNSNVFSHPDTCYVLAFSIIMLNTSLHNPACKTKPTIEMFLSMNRGIDQGKNLPDELLIRLYDSIKSEPFKIPDENEGDDMAFFNPERNGYLTKEGGGHKTWKRRWFTLCNNCLYYFETPEDQKPKGTIPLENLVVRTSSDSKKPNCFEIVCEEGVSVKGAKVNRKGQIVQGKHTSYKIQASSPEEMDEWIKCITKAMRRDPVYELFRRKKDEAVTGMSDY